MRHDLDRCFVAMGSAPDVATVTRTLDARDVEEAQQRAKAVLYPEFSAHARKHITISVQEVYA
jgi:hypothetical protein